MTLQFKKALKFMPLLLLLSLVVVFPSFASPEGSELPLGARLPIWSIIPFVGMLLSIAIFPIVNGHWWEHNLGKVSVFWALLFFVPFFFAFGADEAIYQFLHQVILDYIPFIVLLLGLFAVAGGIVLRGSLVGTPKINLIFLFIGTVLASWIGTTGAAMLLIRPLLRANAWRKRQKHTVVFFIFLVCNIGGTLTPVGDPPLFLGFLRGVPFFWTLVHLWEPFVLNSVILLLVYYLLDSTFYKKDLAEVGGQVPSEEGDGKLRVEGLHNLIFIFMIIGAVIMSGVLPNNPMFADPETGQLYGFTLFSHHGHDIIWSYIDLIRTAIILLAAFLSMKTTSKASREFNRFNWAPIDEVAKLFIGIFLTMIPAMAILAARGSQLGLESPHQFFWVTGLLSSFLDNAPTYLVFLTTAGALGATDGVQTTLGIVDLHLLAAISAGAVFMGANTYIGNAPNFMVKSIAEENGVKMPSFFGYIGWSLVFLIPLFILNTFLFF